VTLLKDVRIRPLSGNLGLLFDNVNVNENRKKYSHVYAIGMYRIAIFKIRPEPERTGYQMNYPAGTGTGYL